MDNAIRAALESWLPLIKGLSFDERVGFLTMTIIALIGLSGTRISSDEILIIRNGIRQDMLSLQSEALAKAKATSASDFPAQDLKLKTENFSHGTPDQIQRSLARAIGRKDAKDIKRLTKALEKAEEK